MIISALGLGQAIGVASMAVKLVAFTRKSARNLRLVMASGAGIDVVPCALLGAETAAWVSGLIAVRLVASQLLSQHGLPGQLKKSQPLDGGPTARAEDQAASRALASRRCPASGWKAGARSPSPSTSRLSSTVAPRRASTSSWRASRSLVRVGLKGFDSENKNPRGFWSSGRFCDVGPQSFGVRQARLTAPFPEAGLA
jgi:hypothetical protein